MTTSSKHPDIQTKWWGFLNFTPLQKSKKIYMHIVLLPNVTSDGFHCEGNIIFPYAKKGKKNSLAFWKSAIVKVIRRTSLWAVGKFAVTNLTNLPYKGNPKKPITTRSAPQKSLPMRVIHTRNFFYSIQFFYSELHVCEQRVIQVTF